MAQTLRGRVIAWSKMTKAQKAEHLAEGHGFQAYVNEANWNPLQTWHVNDLDDLHREDHDDNDDSWDGGYFDAGPFIHIHYLGD